MLGFGRSARERWEAGGSGGATVATERAARAPVRPRNQEISLCIDFSGKPELVGGCSASVCGITNKNKPLLALKMVRIFSSHTLPGNHCAVSQRGFGSGLQRVSMP